MKTKNVLIAVIFLLPGIFSMESKAQENIKAVMKKIESMESVNVNVVRSRDKEGNVTRELVSISFKASTHSGLEQEIIDAFKKDRELASREIENRTGSKITSMRYTFGAFDYSYSYDIPKDEISFFVNEIPPVLR